MATRLQRVRLRAPLVSASITTWEIFFDLIFVFAVARLADLVLASSSAAGYVQAAVILVLTWAMYDAYARLTDSPEDIGWPVRMVVLGGVVGFLVMAVASPDAYGDGRWPFAIAYLVVVVIHAGCSVAIGREPGNDSGIALPYHLGAAGLVVLAALLPDSLRAYAWVLAVIVIVVGALTGRAPSTAFRADHLAERHHLLIMIVLAALVLSVASGAVGRVGDPVVLVAMICAVALVTTLWWIYFGSDDAIGSQAEAETAELRTARQLIITHSLTHLLHVAGLVLLMAGLRAMVADPLSHLTPRSAFAMPIGVAVFCLGEAMYERRLRLGSGLALVVTAVVVLPTVWAGEMVSGLSQLALLLGVLLVHIGLRRVARNPGGVEV